MQWRENNGVRWLEADLGGARAAFSTRLGGVSEPPFDSLNIGLLTDDDSDAVAENRRRLAATLGFRPDQIAIARQVHRTDLVTHPSPSCGSFSTTAVQKEPQVPAGSSCGSLSTSNVRKEPQDVVAADGHVVGGCGLAGLVFVADCLPVALRGPGGVAMLHCGWRGLAAGIVARGAAAVAATEAAIGPGIGPCCFEVGEDVVAAFSHLGEGVVVRPERRGAEVAVAARPHVDLAEAARRLLREAGVERVQSAGLCTSCEAERFFSHRRDDGVTGRQAGIAWMEPDGSAAGAARCPA